MRAIILDTEKLNEDPVFEREYALVSPERQMKIDRIKNRNGKNMSLGAGILEKNFAGNYSYSNLSHSHGMAGIVLSDERAGIDIEQIRQSDIKVAERFFCPDECRFVYENGDTGFFRIWTLKEAFMKATGKGLALGLESFCVCPTEQGVMISQHYDDSLWVFSEFRSHDFCIAVCGKEKVEKLETFVI